MPGILTGLLRINIFHILKIRKEVCDCENDLMKSNYFSYLIMHVYAYKGICTRVQVIMKPEEFYPWG